MGVLSGAAGQAIAWPVENTLGRWLAVPAWHGEDARTFCLEVEPVEFPEWLWWQGGQGFIVRRIAEEEAPTDEESERAVSAPIRRSEEGFESFPTLRLDQA